MKRLRKWLTFVMAFSCLISILPIKQLQAFAEKKEETSLIDTDQLQVSFETESLKENNVWRIKTKRKSDAQRQRLKVKVLTDEKKEIDYPKIKGMEVQEGWLVDQEFTVSEKREMTFKLSEKQKSLLLYVQLDEQQLHSEEGEDEIRKDILETTEPFVLKLQDRKEDKQEHSALSTSNEKRKKTEASKETDKEQEGPRISGSQIANAALPSPVQRAGTYGINRYTNKVPVYKKDTKGTYPTNSWQPDNQTNVINHQGGIENQKGSDDLEIWDGKKNWDVTADRYENSYIHYGGANAPSISLRKYAKETDKEDEFTVKLNVRGGTVQKPGIDIFFLLDNSGSMIQNKIGNLTRKEVANDYLGKLLIALNDQQTVTGGRIQIGGHIFSDYRQWPNEPKLHSLSPTYSNWLQMQNQYASLSSAGDTYTQRGLIESDNYLSKSTDANRRKVLFVLTDGTPTLSATPKGGYVDNNMYYDKIMINNFDYQENYTYGSRFQGVNDPSPTKIKPGNYPNGYKMADGKYINSHITTTNSTAKTLKDKGIEIHTVAIGINPAMDPPRVVEGHTKEELVRGLYKMSTKKFNSQANSDVESDYFFHHAENTSDLGDYFKEWFGTVVRTVDKGTISDPLGSMVEIVDDSGQTPIKVRDVSKRGVTAIEIKNMPSAQLSKDKRTINVGNINLYNNQEVEIEYKVRLKATHQRNIWYPTNGQTTLSPTPETTQDKLDFGVPSVRIGPPDFEIPVQKIWENDTRNGEANFWGKRPKTISALLGRKTATGGMVAEEIIELKEPNWDGKFKAVPGGSENVYCVVERVNAKDRVPGYEPPPEDNTFTSESLGSKKVYITNKLMTTDYSFRKHGHTSADHFTGSDLPRFNVTETQKNIKVMENSKPAEDGLLTLSNIPVGTYLVEETYTPIGYQTADSFVVEVTENSDGTGVIAKVNGQEGQHEIYNKLKDFTLTINKKNDSGDELAGAEFKVTGTNGTTYNETKFDGPTFTFAGLKPGKYQLEETKSPPGYEGLADLVNFEISSKGDVTISSNDPLIEVVANGITKYGNKIELNVKNTSKKGALPTTGDWGIGGFMQIAFGLAIVGGVLCLTYLYINYRKRSS